MAFFPDRQAKVKLYIPTTDCLLPAFLDLSMATCSVIDQCPAFHNSHLGRRRPRIATAASAQRGQKISDEWTPPTKPEV